jgi:hypothetical protein
MASEITYAAGEKACEKCGEPLGEIRCTTDRIHFVCNRREYVIPANRMVPVIIIRSGERVCDAENCTRFMPARAYPTRQRRFFCLKRCQGRYRSQRGSQHVQYAYCGKELRRSPSSATGLRFCMGHGGAIPSGRTGPGVLRSSSSTGGVFRRIRRRPRIQKSSRTNWNTWPLRSKSDVRTPAKCGASKIICGSLQRATTVRHGPR